MISNYTFLYPVIEKRHAWIAVSCDYLATGSPDADSFARRFKEADVTALTNLLPMILPVAAEWLDNEEFLEALAPGKAIFLLPQESLDNEPLLQRCEALRREERNIGLHLSDTKNWKRIPKTAFDHVHFTAAFARNEMQLANIHQAKDSPFRRIVVRVGTYEMHDWLKQHGFEWCDSNFLTARNPAINKKPDLAKLKLLKLLAIVDRDGDNREIEAVLREEPKLSYNLLRLVNSVTVGSRMRIHNFSQAITILGRRQLQRWLQLLVYANHLSDTNAPNPLMQLAAYRGHLLELFGKSTNPGNQRNCDNAFLVGLFSLLDVLLNMPMGEILKELPLDEEVSLALNAPGQGNKLAQMLSTVIDIGSGNFPKAAETLSELGINPETLFQTQIAALNWAARINMEQ